VRELPGPIATSTTSGAFCRGLLQRQTGWLFTAPVGAHVPRLAPLVPPHAQLPCPLRSFTRPDQYRKIFIWASCPGRRTGIYGTSERQFARSNLAVGIVQQRDRIVVAAVSEPAIACRHRCAAAYPLPEPLQGRLPDPRGSPAQAQSEAEGPLFDALASRIGDADRLHESAAVDRGARHGVVRRVSHVEHFRPE
jgi:hypothetical protein